MTEITTTSQRTAAFYLVQILSWIGMFLVWFEGDQDPALVIPYFAIHVGTMFLSASFWLTEANSQRNLAIRTIGSFFLLQAIEGALCLLRPTYTGAVQPNDHFTSGHNRYRAAYCGAVLILISVFLSFLLAYTHFQAPSNAGSRIATLRGLLYLVAVAACIVSSCISWSYKPVCSSTPDHTHFNAQLILTAFIILSTLLYGDGESDSTALLLACMFVINYGPVFYNIATIGVKHQKWRAEIAVAFTGLYCFIVGLFVERVFNGSSASIGDRISSGIKERINKLDLISAALGFAGAVCLYAFDTTDNADYYASYGLIIPLFSIVGVLTATDAGKIIATFFGYVVLSNFYDIGSGQTTTGYTRGGLMMLEASVLVMVLAHAIRGRSLDKIVTYPAYVAIAQFVIGCMNVPNDYSRYFLVALTVISAENYDDADYGRVSFLLLAWGGFVANFLLTTTPGVFQIINWVSALIFTYQYMQGGARQAPALKFGSDMNAPIEAVTAENPKEAA